MAKNKDNPFAELEIQQPPQPLVAQGGVGDSGDEMQRLRDRIAELEANAMAKSAGPIIATDGDNMNHVEGIAPDLNANFEVSVKDSAQGVRVFASDPPNAMARYLKKVGVIHTMYQPEINRIA